MGPVADDQRRLVQGGVERERVHGREADVLEIDLIA